MIVKISGYESTINDSTFEMYSKYKWHINRNLEKDHRYYFQTDIKIDGKRFVTTLHRYLMGCTPHDGNVVDHIDGNTLNNDIDNLRICTNAENARNRKVNKNNTSGRKGVSYHKATGKWQASICIGNKQIYLGLHVTPEIAHEAYKEAVIKYHGEFGRTK